MGAQILRGAGRRTNDNDDDSVDNYSGEGADGPIIEEMFDDDEEEEAPQGGQVNLVMGEGGDDDDERPPSQFYASLPSFDAQLRSADSGCMPSTSRK